MCRLITIANYQEGLLDYEDKIKEMNSLLKYKKQEYSFMNHCYLSLIDSQTIQEPIHYEYQGKRYHIAFDGLLYNALDIKNQLLALGFTFCTTSDSEIVLKSYLAWHEQCLNYFEGMFAFVIDDGEKLFIARDQLGVKPLFYCFDEHSIIIASEIKCLLAYLGKAIVDKDGIKELLALGPSLSPGHTIYKGIYSLRPAHYMFYQEKADIKRYWILHDEEHTDNFDQTIKRVKKLVIESIQKQLISDTPISTMLSGGLDSSIITAITSQYSHNLSTYSVTYKDQEKYFQAYDYQTSMDDSFINEVKERYQTHHHQVTLTQKQLVHSLKDSLIARDMPGMADIDSSFLLFSHEISKHHHICLSGECADEIFGGYPWFYKKELYEQPYFPWMRDLDLKMSLFNEKINQLNLKEYIIQKYQESLNELQTNDLKKQLIYLNIEWFMQTLLTRATSQSIPSSLEVRVPFADVKIVQYLYNMPTDYMFYNHEEKGILRLAFEDFLPKDIAHRKKNPYPKTHSPVYEKLIYEKLKTSLKDSSNILYEFFDKEKLYEFVESKGRSFDVPWFGQLMMGPQLMAYFYQIYLWGKIYHIQLEL